MNTINRASRTALAASVLWTCPSLAGQPYAVDEGIMRGVLHTDARVIWLGDSYALPYPSRVSGGSLLSWRFDDWSAFTLGDGPSWFHVTYSPLDDEMGLIHSSTNFQLYGTGPDETTRYALPVWRIREYFRAAGDQGTAPLMRYSIRPDKLTPGYLGPFAEAGEALRIRPLLLDPPGDPVSVPSVRYEDEESGNAVSFDPRTQSLPKRLDGHDPHLDPPVPPTDGHVFASPFEFDVVAKPNGRAEFVLTDTSADGETGYVFPSGFIASRRVQTGPNAGDRVPGIYFSVLTDGSWSYQSFGLDMPSNAPGAPVKTYSVEQMAHWLDSTTLDPSQPVYAFYLLNVEDIAPTTAALQMEAMIDQTEEGAQSSGITGSLHHCIVIPWNHRISGAFIPGRHEEQRDAAFTFAESRENVSAISIYDFTDEQVFDGNPDSKQWLIDNGYHNFSYGNVTVDLASNGSGANGGLLDIFKSHPEGQDAGAFFSHIIERVVIESCPADFAPPYGVLDLADITGFITRFSEMRPSADLAEPRGAFDLADLAAFVQAFTGGCAE